MIHVVGHRTQQKGNEVRTIMHLNHIDYWCNLCWWIWKGCDLLGNSKCVITSLMVGRTHSRRRPGRGRCRWCRRQRRQKFQHMSLVAAPDLKDLQHINPQHILKSVNDRESHTSDIKNQWWMQLPERASSERVPNHLITYKENSVMWLNTTSQRWPCGLRHEQGWRHHCFDHAVTKGVMGN